MSKDYYKQVPSKNILNDKDSYLSSSIQNQFTDNALNNMIINSNLENNNNIK